MKEYEESKAKKTTDRANDEEKLRRKYISELQIAILDEEKKNIDLKN